MSDYTLLKQKAYEANLQLPQLGLVKFTFGNVSVADPEQRVFAIKPSGVEYSDLSPEKMVIVNYKNEVLQGDLRPSSDTATHAVLYNEWNSVKSIVHTHSTYATAWAQAQRAIPVYGTTHADYSRHDIPCAAPMSDEKIEGQYEYETGRQIIDHFSQAHLDPEETPMILLGNHAPFAWGSSPEKAIYNAAILEELAKIAWLTEQINPGAARMKESLIQKHFNRKHGAGSYYGQSKK